MPTTPTARETIEEEIAVLQEKATSTSEAGVEGRQRRRGRRRCHGRVHLASSKRVATIVDAANNLLLECMIRRVFESSKGQECMLLFPNDTPVQILKSSNFNGWSVVNDEEVEAIIPAASYSLAKIHMHLVISGFCYTARGGFCYSEEEIL